MKSNLPANKRRIHLSWLALLAANLAVYASLGEHDFVNFDDPMFLYENSYVTKISVRGLIWAWTNKDAVLWQPLTWMGHMAISAIGGMDPTIHLFSNFGLHVLNAGLLFAMILRLTGFVGRSFAVALLFSVHPVNVETVAWASQLKSTLSTSFFLLGLLEYLRGIERRREGSVAVLGLFALSLLSKPMLLFFPLVLALVDFLQPNALPSGTATRTWQAWAARKVPFVALALVMLIMTVVPWTSATAADMAPMQAPDFQRLLAVPCNYFGFLKLVFWPAQLAVLYPEAPQHSFSEVAFSVFLLISVTMAAWYMRRRVPLFLFGWCWFIITMIPASGLLRAGQHALADRYIYVPGIGLFVAVVWLLAEWSIPRAPKLQAALLAVVAIALGVVARRQVGFWQDSVTLWQHAAEVTAPTAVRHINLGNALLGTGREHEAEAEFYSAIRLESNDPRPHINLAVMAQKRGDIAGAIERTRHALELAPTDARIMSNLGSLLEDSGNSTEARQLLERAVGLRPDLAEANLNLGVLCARAGELERAQQLFEGVTRLRPHDASARHNLGLVRRQLELRRSGADAARSGKQ